MTPPRFCQVALPRPVRQTFVYRIPEGLEGAVRVGVRVLVPFGRRKVIGLVTELQEETDRSRVRGLTDVVDDEPVLRTSELDLCRWVAGYYVAPLGLVLRATLPPGSFSESGHRVRLTGAGEEEVAGGGNAGGEGDDGPEDADPEARILRRLARSRDGLLVTSLRDELDLTRAWPRVRDLRDRGLVDVREERPDTDPGGPTRQVIRITRELPTLAEREETFGRAHRQREAFEVLEELDGEAAVAHLEDRMGFSRSVIRGLAERGVAEITAEEVRRDPYGDPDREEGEPEPRHRPTPAQREVIDDLAGTLDRSDPGVALLRGVTGSGKTLVYLELLEEVVDRRGRGAIVLVPEISLTPQTVRRFRARFGDRVAVLHSRLSRGERRDEWRALREGSKRVAVGARSAVFAPVADLGVVVVDEAHDGSYKQSDVPRYHARSVAAVRCREAGALCLLGSATPSLESWARARAGEYRLHELPDRVTPHPLPSVELVDLRSQEPEPAPGAGGEEGAGPSAGGGVPVFSAELRDALEETLDRGDQAILLLNRRGFSNFLQCRGCGKVWECRRCSVSLTHHRTPERLTCHHCGFERPVPPACEDCGEEHLRHAGVGTEQLERRLGELLPEVRVARMDVDTTGTRWAHERILERVRRREVDVLLGTQMIAKGLDLPDVTLVGVVNADVGLNLPDFRATERTFQLLAQVAGRAGRGERPGRVLVQTSRPEHFALQAAVDHDYPGFAERELEDRSLPGYPPHRRMANLVVSGADPDRTAAEAAEVAEWTAGLLAEQELEDVELVGPAPCPIERLRGRWRWHFFLRSRSAGPLGAVLRYLADKRAQPGGELRLEIDRDPEALL